MKERPIIFSTGLIPPTLDGRKTQTRRPANISDGCFDLQLCRPLEGSFGKKNDGRFGVMFKLPKSQWFDDDKPFHDFVPCPYGQPGDRLWVRETLFNDGDSDWMYADGTYVDTVEFYPEDWMKRNCWRSVVPSIHMPRWASRIILEITDVRVERVQEISEKDALKDGCSILPWWDGEHTLRNDGKAIESPACARNGFANIWNSIYAKKGYGWDVNPFVWVVEFKLTYPSNSK